MIEKLKEYKKTIIVVLFILGAALAWWQSRDAEEKSVEPTVKEECNKE
jgi:protein-S-isoprenylcysteine O-methyltransferase Ste14